MFDLDQLFQKSELIPVIIQDDQTLEVLMLGFTNREAVELTMQDRDRLVLEPQPAEASGTRGELGELPPCEADGRRLRRRHPALPLCTPDDPPATGAVSCFFQRNYGIDGRPRPRNRRKPMSDTVLKEDLYPGGPGRKSTPRRVLYLLPLRQGAGQDTQKGGGRSAPRPSSPPERRGRTPWGRSPTSSTT